jgi:hypothetical protein
MMGRLPPKTIKQQRDGCTVGNEADDKPIKFLQGRNGRPGKDLTRMPCVNPTVTACD